VVVLFNWFKLAYRRLLSLPLLLSVLFLFCQCAIYCPAFAASPLAVLKSARNAAAYQDQHLGTFEEDWLSFKQTLEAANVTYDELNDADVAAGPSRIATYKIIIVPLLVDLSPEVANALSEFQRGGGKLVVTDGGGTPLSGAQTVDQLAGVTVVRQNTASEKRKLEWPKPPLPWTGEFAVGTVTADVKLAEGAQPLAKWADTTGNTTGQAVIRRNNAVFIAWAPGLQGEITLNASVLSMAMEELSPGLTQQAAVQISFADYQTIQQELDYLAKRTQETIKTARQADLAVPFHIIQQHYDSALKQMKLFDEAYHNRHFYEADEYLRQARQDFSMAFGQAMPVRPVEARSIWLDRGSIVATHDAKGMSKLFDRLKSSGINVVYFETNNAGFTMYPSKMAAQNPQVVGWDPLGVAVREAHKRGMELHSWVWIFNVGNAKHNPIIGREGDYPGPVLSSHDLAWALASSNGSLMPPRQHEYWLDPSNPSCREYAKAMILEVVDKYPVDGIQLDYIRYPFNNKGSEMGFNWLARMRFEQDTGLSLDKLDEETRQVWQAWKIAQIDSFVKDISATLKRQKPSLRLSAAVYAMPRRMRINSIQQEWETWVKNGWVDTLNPMTYVSNAKELTNMAGYVRETTADHALVYPGLSIRQLDTAGLVEQLDSARETGTLGTTIFAVAHLDDQKVNVLKLGPYRKQPLLTPQSEPIRASRLLIDDFATMVNRYLQDPHKHILSDQASTNDVLSQIDAIQRALHLLSSAAPPDQIDSVYKDVASLHNTMKEWLRLEAFIQRGYRAQYIVSYLGQVEAILSYASHKARSEKENLAASQRLLHD
jgi:uncharacterized lipoprotein YddW (UPF0748 family)